MFQHRGAEAIGMLDDWLAWARRSQIPPFVEFYHRIKKHRAGIVAAVTRGLSNGLTESVNTKIRLLKWIIFGSQNPRAQIPNLLAMYRVGVLKLDELVTRRDTLDQFTDGGPKSP